MSRPAAKSSGKKTPLWSEEELKVLAPFKAAWRAADAQGRKTLLSEQILKAFFDLHPGIVGVERDNMKTKVKGWFHNNARTKKKESKYLLLPRASISKVLLHYKKDEIQAELQKLTDVAPGHPEYLGNYTRAKKNVREALGADEEEKLRDEQIKWESEGWPVDMQRKEATRQARILSESMDRLRYKRMGARMITILVYKNTDGELGLETYDFNQKLGGGAEKIPPFTVKYKDAVDVIEQAMWDYINDIKVANGEEGAGSTEKENHGKNKKRPLPAMSQSPGGFPMLPAVCDEEANLQYKKDLLRGFLSAHYHLASGSDTKAPPFTALHMHNSDWADAEYWPPGINIQDPSRMNEPQLVVALAFWRARGMSEPDNVFRWAAVETGRRGHTKRVPAPYPATDRPGPNPAPPITPSAALHQVVNSSDGPTPEMSGPQPAVAAVPVGLHTAEASVPVGPHTAEAAGPMGPHTAEAAGPVGPQTAEAAALAGPQTAEAAVPVENSAAAVTATETDQTGGMNADTAAHSLNVGQIGVITAAAPLVGDNAGDAIIPEAPWKGPNLFLQPDLYYTPPQYDGSSGGMLLDPKLFTFADDFSQWGEWSQGPTVPAVSLGEYNFNVNDFITVQQTNIDVAASGPVTNPAILQHDEPLPPGSQIEAPPSIKVIVVPPIPPLNSPPGLINTCSPRNVARSLPTECTPITVTTTQPHCPPTLSGPPPMTTGAAPANPSQGPTPAATPAAAAAPPIFRHKAPSNISPASGPPVTVYEKRASKDLTQSSAADGSPSTSKMGDGSENATTDLPIVSEIPRPRLYTGPLRDLDSTGERKVKAGRKRRAPMEAGLPGDEPPQKKQKLPAKGVPKVAKNPSLAKGATVAPADENERRPQRVRKPTEKAGYIATKGT